MSLEVLRALANPLRLRILSLVTGTALSAAELARELDVAHASASYHLRQLAAAGLVVTAEERVTRGGRERRYRYVQESSSFAGMSMAPGAVALLAEALAAELRRRTALAAERPRLMDADAELWVDPAAWSAVREDVSAALRRLHDVALPPRTDGTVRISVTAMLFEMTDAQTTAVTQ